MKLRETPDGAGDVMQSDVLVVGGGLAGCSLAYFLAREGVDVLVLERFDLNSMASGANAGSIHCQIPHKEFVTKGEDWARAFAPALPLMKRSIAMWDELGPELGVDLELELTGGLLVAKTEAQMRDIERKARIERAHGVTIDLLSRDDLRQVAPYISDHMIGAAYCPHEGKANPLVAAPAFARAADAMHARFRPKTSLNAIDIERDGFTARSSAGPIRTRRIVNCAGADAGWVASMVGVDLPIQGFPIQVTVTERVAPLVPHLLYSAGSRLTLKQAHSGGFLIGGGWPARLGRDDGHPRLDRASLMGNMRAAVDVVPELRALSLLRAWPAIVNGTADWRPVLGEVPGVKGFYMNMFPWMGFTAGPMSARIVADLILGHAPACDIAGVSTLYDKA